MIMSLAQLDEMLNNIWMYVKTSKCRREVLMGYMGGEVLYDNGCEFCDNEGGIGFDEKGNRRIKAKRGIPIPYNIKDFDEIIGLKNTALKEKESVEKRFYAQFKDLFARKNKLDRHSAIILRHIRIAADRLC